MGREIVEIVVSHERILPFVSFSYGRHPISLGVKSAGTPGKTKNQLAGWFFVYTLFLQNNASVVLTGATVYQYGVR